MVEINEKIMRNAKIITWIWIGLLWVWLIFSGYSLIVIFWNYGGSLVQLAIASNGGLLIAFAGIVVVLISFTFFFYHSMRDWSYKLLYKKRERLEGESEILKLMQALERKNKEIKQLKTDNKYLLALVNNRYDGVKQVPIEKKGGKAELPKPKPTQVTRLGATRTL